MRRKDKKVRDAPIQADNNWHEANKTVKIYTHEIKNTNQVLLQSSLPWLVVGRNEAHETPGP